MSDSESDSDERTPSMLLVQGLQTSTPTCSDDDFSELGKPTKTVLTVFPKECVSEKPLPNLSHRSKKKTCCFKKGCNIL